MLQFTYKLKVVERIKGKCERHPRYNPEGDGREGIKGGCSTCYSLYDLYRARLTLDAAHREFLRRATPLGPSRETTNNTGYINERPNKAGRIAGPLVSQG